MFHVPGTVSSSVFLSSLTTFGGGEIASLNCFVTRTVTAEDRATYANWPEQPLSSEVFHARLKTLGGPVKISLGYYVFEVIRRVPARQSTLAEVKPEIATQLHRLLRDRMLSRFVAAFRRKWTSRTNCLHGYVVKYCRQYRSSRANSQEAPNVL